MYMLKAQKRLQSLERHEDEERRLEQIERHVGGLKIVRGAVSNEIPEEGPVGAKKKVKYVGSFKVFPPEGLSGKELQSSISGFVWDRITVINPKKVGNPISGTMIINRHAVKVFKDKELFMAYPLKRISYCTAVPKNSLFAIVTHPILGQPKNILYCHTFGLPNAQHANEVSQLVSEAFKIAFAHRTLRRSIEMEAKDKRGGGDGKEKKGGKWDVLKRKDKKKSPAPSPSLSHTQLPSAPPRPPPPTSSSNELVPPTAPPPFSIDTPPLPNRSGSISSSGVTVVGLETEILSLEQRINDLEMRLHSLSQHDDAALELTIQLSALEDKIQVKRTQLTTLSLLEATNDSSSWERPPSYNEMESGSSSISGHLQPPPSFLGVPENPSRVSVAFDDQELQLQDNGWYQAGLPRELVMELLTHQPPGSFIVRESSSNPGCHAISVVAQDGQILHYLLVRDSQGYFIQGSELRHPNLHSLILYHASFLDFLPVVLSLGCTNPLANLPPPPGGVPGDVPTSSSNDWMYNDSDDDEIGDEEMQAHLSNLQFFNP